MAVCRAGDVELRASARVERIRVERGAVTGVRLAGEETIDAPAVLSAVDFRTTVLDLLEPPVVPLELESAARAWKNRGALAAVRLALDAPPAFAEARLRAGRPTRCCPYVLGRTLRASQ